MAFEIRATPWPRERIESMLRKENFRYQDIPLPHGLSTGGHDRSATAARIFPDSLEGKTVVDLGCSFGYFCFEAIRRGAKRVVGYDVDPESVRKAKLLAECLGHDVEFDLRDIEREPLREKFDYVLCLNLLHHLKNPIGALDGLIECTRERLVLEVASLGLHDRKKIGVSWLAHSMLTRLPIMFVSKSGTKGKRQVQKFFITPQAIRNLLIQHRGMFASLDVVPSEHKNRYIAIGHKRRIGHLLVVSGPTSSGKKTLMQRLISGQLPQLARRLGTADGSAWGKPLNADKIDRPMEANADRLILHHDFMRPYLRSAMVHERDEAMDILDTADRVTFVTVWTPPERLIRQITEAEIEPKLKDRKAGKPSRHIAIRELYRDRDKVLDHYRRWFAFAAKHSDQHIVVSAEDELELLSVDEWERRVGIKAPAREMEVAL